MNFEKKMRVVFMGTPDLAAKILQALTVDDGLDVVAVYTNADAVSKRGNKLIPSPVKVVAEQAGIDVHTPKTFHDDVVVEELLAYKPHFICVAAYGMLLPKRVLDVPAYECLNVHGSLLPRWRGAAPIQRAILDGDKYTGVSIMRMVEGMDTGPYCWARAVEIGDKAFAEIEKEIALAGIDGLLETMRSIAGDGKVAWVEQTESEVTHADKIQKRELWLDPSQSALEAKLKVQASNNAHVCKCNIAGKNVAILSSQIAEGSDPVSAEAIAKPQGSVTFKNKCLFLSFADGALKIGDVKPDGKNVMESTAFASGIQNLKNGEVEWNVCS